MAAVAILAVGYRGVPDLPVVVSHAGFECSTWHVRAVTMNHPDFQVEAIAARPRNERRKKEERNSAAEFSQLFNVTSRKTKRAGASGDRSASLAPCNGLSVRLRNTNSEAKEATRQSRCPLQS